MSHCVFILGAGASAPSGCPVMNNFFSIGDALYRDAIIRGNTDGCPEQAEFIRLHQFRDYIRKNRTQITTDVDNLESVFNTIELSRFLGGLGSHGPEKLESIRSDFLSVLCRVLLLSQKVQAVHMEHHSDGGPTGPRTMPNEYMLIMKAVGRASESIKNLLYVQRLF